jgi:NAD-dependent deacetylase
VQDIRERIRQAGSICVVSGAGISAESGIPTFRGAGGLWHNFRAEDLATPDAFKRDPKLVWQWYDWRRQLIAKAEPNPGHYAVSRLKIVTQNVDGLHQRAGAKDVLELHGSIWTIRCTACDYQTQDMRVPLPEIPPLCSCGALLRPGVVWFGEGLPVDVWDNAQQAVLSAKVLLVVGTSALVYPAASLIPLAKRAGAFVIEINPDDTSVSAAVDHAIRGRAGEVLPKLLE